MCPLQLEIRLDFPEATKRFREVPVGTREKPNASHGNSRNITRFPTQCETIPDSSAVTREESHTSLTSQKET